MNAISRSDINRLISYFLREKPRAIYIPLLQYELDITEEEAINLYDGYMDNDGITIFSEFFYTTQ